MRTPTWTRPPAEDPSTWSLIHTLLLKGIWANNVARGSAMPATGRAVKGGASGSSGAVRGGGNTAPAVPATPLAAEPPPAGPAPEPDGDDVAIENLQILPATGEDSRAIANSVAHQTINNGQEILYRLLSL